MKHPLLLFITAVLLPAYLFAQPPICGPGAEMSPNCGGACVICDIDGFGGTNEGNQGGTAPPGYCTAIIHHMEWIGFVAATTSVSLQISVSNCNGGGGNGLEAGIYEGIDCQNFNLISNCETDIYNNTSVVLTTTIPLVIGQYYWLVMDSNGGNACDFSVSVVGGSTALPPPDPISAILGPANICPGGMGSFSISPVPNAPQVNWTVDGTPAGEGEMVDLLFPNQGQVQVCVEASNVCHPPVSLCTTVDVTPLPPTEVSETICENDCYVADSGDEFCLAGVYPVIYSSFQGCDSVVNYTINVIPEPIVVVTATICEGGSYAVGNEVFTLAGIYEIGLTGALGCDSTVILTLFIEPNSETIFTEEICEGEVFIFGMQAYTQTGVYSEVFPSAQGCDSTVTLNLTVHPVDSVYLTEIICQGDSIMVGNEWFNIAGNYEVVLQNATGCDSTVFLELSVNELVVINLTEEICDGNTYTIGTEIFDTTGNFQVILIDTNGCDSIVNLDLTVMEALETQLPVQICEGQSYTVGTETFTDSGQYEITLASSSGCDSIVFLDLDVVLVLETNLVENICEGQSYTVGNETFTATGEFEVNLTSNTGCDSIVYLDLTVNPQPETQLPISICDSETYMVGNEIFDQTGVYEIVLTTPAGCDSTVLLDLTVLPNPESFFMEQICLGETYTAGNETFAQTGQYDITLPASNGCDSTIHLDLEVLTTYQTNIVEQICEGEAYTIGSESFDQTGQYEVTLASTLGCDSVVSLDLLVLDFLQTNLTESVCAGETFQVGNEVFDQTGQYQIDLTAASGCDSIVMLDLEVIQELETPLIVILCNGGTYQVGTESFGQTGLYEILFTAASGCDSLVQLDLMVMPPIVENLQVEICQGTSYTIGNQVFDQAGQYQVDFVTAGGCDSTILLDLGVADFLQTNLSETLCDGESFLVGSEVFGQTGMYQVDFVTAGGCDSIVFLDLLVLQNWQTDLVERICESEIYQVGNETFSQTGHYEVKLSASTGCDSLVVLDLEVIPIETAFLAEEICNGQTYTIGNEQFTQAGQYEVTLTAVSGCDSVISLDLVVLNCNVFAAFTTSAVNCFGGDDGFIEFLVENGAAPIVYEWVQIGNPVVSGNGTVNSLGQAILVENLPSGQYQFNLTDANGYTFQQNIDLTEPLLLEVQIAASQFGNFNLPCYGDQNGFLSASANGGTAPYQFQWGNGTQGADLQNIGAGQYEVTITDGHDCPIVLQENIQEPPAIQWVVAIDKPSCDAPLGTISIENVVGGAMPYTYLLNGISQSGNPVYSALEPSEYQLALIDDNGCEVDTSIYLTPAPEIIVSLGNDITVDLGDEVRLTPLVLPTLPDTYFWEGEGLSCYDCFAPMAAPLQTTTYQLTASTDDGCQATDELTIFVRKDYNVFIPNAFSPNGDGLNDVLTVFSGNDVAKVNAMKVFSRWGESVFQYFDFPTNDATFSWDGKHKGQQLQPGIFTWFAEVEFVDGEVKLFKGDVVLVR